MRRPPVKLLLLTLCLLAADQLSKIVVSQWLELGDFVQVLPFFRLQRVQNQGIAFGMMNESSTLIIAVSGAIVLVLVAAALIMRNDRRLLWPLALLVAGSAGNLIDRVLNGSVTDFLQVPHWPAFNLADSYIVIGVGLLAVRLLIWPKPSASNERENVGPLANNERENVVPPGSYLDKK